MDEFNELNEKIGDIIDSSRYDISNYYYCYAFVEDASEGYEACDFKHIATYYLHAQKGSSVSINSPYTLEISCYDKSLNFLELVTLKDDKAVVNNTNTEYVKIIFSKNDKTEITELEAKNILENAKVYSMCGLIQDMQSLDYNVLSSKLSFESIVYLNKFIRGVPFEYKDYDTTPIHQAVLLWSADANPCAGMSYINQLRLKVGSTFKGLDYSIYKWTIGLHNGDWYEGGYVSKDIVIENQEMANNVNRVIVKRLDNASMTYDDIMYLNTHLYIEIPENTNNTISKITSTSKPNNFMHFSFDDVSYCLNNIISKSYDSIFDEPFFRMLKLLHQKYNTVFSLYVSNKSSFNNIPLKFKNELKNSSHWLKFGFHLDGSEFNSATTYDDAMTKYNSFINNIYEKVGGLNSIDRMPRLDRFSGSLDACKALRDADCGCIGFLSADDSRNAYYLNNNQLTYLSKHSYYSDLTNGLQFMSTNMRLDWFKSDFTSDYVYNKPVKSNPYDELVYRYYDPAFSDLYHNLIVFTHEWQVYDGTTINSFKDYIEQVCKFANDYNYANDYPQNRIEDIRYLSINK